MSLGTSYFLFTVVLCVLVLSCGVYGRPGDLKVGANCTIDTQRRFCGDELVCRNGTCSYCSDDVQCQTIYSTNICKFVTMKNSTGTATVGTCAHKPLFPKVSVWDVLSTVTTFIAGVVSSGGGIGGGGLYIPLLTSAGQFVAHLAVPISMAMICGASLMTFFIQARERHPTADRPLIDYDVCMLLEPATLAGTVIGVFLNVMFPGWLILILVLILLTITTYRMFKKGIETWRKEHELSSKPSASDINADKQDIVPLMVDVQDEDEEEDTTGILNQSTQIGSPTGDYNTLPQPHEDLMHDQAPVRDPVKYRAIIEKEARTPWPTVLVLITCWIIIMLLSLFKGAHGAPSVVGVQSCSAWYWVLACLTFPIVFVMTAGVGYYLVAKHREKVECGYQFHEGDVHYTISNVIWYPAICVFAGIMASLLGIGGGMIKGPLLLELGVVPAVSGASASFMILFTSSITTVQFIIMGLLPWDYGLWFAANGFLAGLVGTLLIGYLVRKYKKQSIIIFFVAVAILFAAFLMSGVGIFGVVRDIQDGVYVCSILYSLLIHNRWASKNPVNYCCLKYVFTRILLCFLLKVNLAMGFCEAFHGHV
jgi:uncharacterized membrane protein YfcA